MDPDGDPGMDPHDWPRARKQAQLDKARQFFRRGRRCHVCGDPDHIKPDCPHWKNTKCLHCLQCGKAGHLQQACMMGFLHRMPKYKMGRFPSFWTEDPEAERQRAEDRAEWEADRVRRQAEAIEAEAQRDRNGGWWRHRDRVPSYEPIFHQWLARRGVVVPAWFARNRQLTEAQRLESWLRRRTEAFWKYYADLYAEEAAERGRAFERVEGETHQQYKKRCAQFRAEQDARVGRPR